MPTYGIFSGGIGSHLTDIADKFGYEFAYINKVLMVDNWLPGFDMKKQIEGEPKKNIEEQIVKIKSDIYNGKNILCLSLFLEKLPLNLWLAEQKSRKTKM